MRNGTGIDFNGFKIFNSRKTSSHTGVIFVHFGFQFVDQFVSFLATSLVIINLLQQLRLPGNQRHFLLKHVDIQNKSKIVIRECCCISMIDGRMKEIPISIDRKINGKRNE